jgi:CheY-like chemotaxis protein
MLPKPRVLLVDDEREILTVLREALEISGFEIATATDGEQALRQVSSFRPHAVVLDVIIPKENGYRVSRRIKTGELSGQGAPVPHVILLTGRRLAEHPEREEMFQEFSMADTVLYKPVDLPDLVECLGQAVAGAATTR